MYTCSEVVNPQAELRVQYRNKFKDASVKVKFMATLWIIKREKLLIGEVSFFIFGRLRVMDNNFFNKLKEIEVDILKRC